MKPKSLMLTLGLALVTACAAAAKQPVPADFIGVWKITEVAGYGDQGGGEPLSKQLVGKTLAISEDGMVLGVDGWSCKARGAYRVSLFDSGGLVQDAGAEPTDVGLPAKVPALDSDGCLQVWWLGDGRVEFDYMGVFVRAGRI